MSFEALAWAAKCKIPRSTDKLVLLGLAECADRESHEAFPSIAALVEFGSLNRKTVIASLDRLEACGLIISTGSHKGKTNQIKVYKLSVGTVPKTEQSQKRNSPKITREQSQKRDTDTVKEPVTSEAKASSVARQPKSDGYHRLPEGWVPTRPLPPNTHAKVSHWPPGALDDELAAMHRWALNAANVNGKGKKKDWDSAWVNWLERKHGERQDYRRSGAQQPDGRGKTGAAIDRLLKRTEAGYGGGKAYALPS